MRPIWYAVIGAVVVLVAILAWVVLVRGG